MTIVNESEAVWVTKGRKEVPVSKLIDSHLLNIIPHIFRGGGYEDTITEKLAIALFGELERRGLKTRIPKDGFISYCYERELRYIMHMDAYFMELTED